MLPDFPSVKAHLGVALIRWTQEQVPQIAPLLGQIGSFHQHEGKRGHLSRADKSSDEMKYEPHRFEFVLTREEMRKTDLPGLFEKLRKLAEQIADAQSTLMYTRISEAVEPIGNTVDAGGDFQPKHFFEMLSKIQMEFDPATGKPTGHVFSMHPDTAAKVIPKLQAWEQDPAFKEEYERILETKREEWRDREDRRKLVD